MQGLVGLGRFELPSRAPEAQSLDQASRQPQTCGLHTLKDNLPLIIKTLTRIQHFSKANQKAINSRLERIAREVNLENPSEVEKFIYDLDISNNYKNKLFLAYQSLREANNISYKKPKNLLVKPYVIHVPTEQRINTIIACCRWVYSTIFNISKYGLRPHEISKLTLRNIDLEKGKLTVPTSKLGLQRTIQLKRQTIELLKEYINRKRITSIDQKLFGSARKIKESWRKYRKRAYAKFKGSQLLKIRLYDLRHWFATITYQN